MESSLHSARNLSPAVRQALESLLGRALNDEESISVRTYEPHEAPGAEARRAAVRGLERYFAEMDARRESVSEKELDEALDEALRSVRPGYTPVR